jgi:hypothetical protein
MTKADLRRETLELRKIREIRDSVSAAYSRVTGRVLSMSKAKASYDRLSETIEQAVGSNVSNGTLCKFFSQNSDRTYERRVVSALEKFAAIYAGEAVATLPAARIEGKLLDSFRQGASSARQELFQIPTLSFEFLRAADLELLKQFRDPPELAEIKWDVIEQRLERHPRIIQGLLVNLGSSRHVLGFFIVYPISAQCEERIKDGRLTGSSHFKAGDVCGELDEPSGLYVSWVFAKGSTGKGEVLRRLKRELRLRVADYRSINALYARPTTEAGLKVLMKYGFVSIGKSRIYSLSRQRLFKQLRTG